MKKVVVVSLLLALSATLSLAADTVAVYVNVNGHRLDPAPSKLKIRGYNPSDAFASYDKTIWGKNPAVFPKPFKYTVTLPDGTTKNKDLPEKGSAAWFTSEYKDSFTVSFDNIPPSNQITIYNRIKGTHFSPKGTMCLVENLSGKRIEAGKIATNFTFKGLKRLAMYHAEGDIMSMGRTAKSRDFQFSGDFMDESFTLEYEGLPSIVRELKSNVQLTKDQMDSTERPQGQLLAPVNFPTTDVKPKY
jgi:hypothetical protein